MKINKKLTKLLTDLGFHQESGYYWKHPEMGMIRVEDTDTPENIAKEIFKLGGCRAQASIRRSLGIM